MALNTAANYMSRRQQQRETLPERRAALSSWQDNVRVLENQIRSVVDVRIQGKISEWAQGSKHVLIALTLHRAEMAS